MRAEDLLRTCSIVIDDAVLLQLSGELDIATAPLLDDATAACLAEHPHQLHLDVASLTFCDAAGLRGLLRTRRCARAQNIVFRLVGIHPRLHRILALYGAFGHSQT